MSFRLTKKDTKYLNNPEEVIQLATFLKGLGGTESERAVKAMREERIKAKILSPEMRSFQWVIGHVPAENLTHRVDGMHSTNVFLGLTTEEWVLVNFPVIIDWEEYECETLVDLAILFEQFNPSWSARNTEDLARAHMGIHTHYKGYPPKLGTRISAGLGWYERMVEQRWNGRETQFQFFHINHDVQTFFAWARTVLHATQATRMHAAPVIAAMYHTTRCNQPPSKREAALGFWKEVANGHQFVPEGSMAYKLDVFLENFKTRTTPWPSSTVKQFKNNQHHPTPEDVFVSCLRMVDRALRTYPVSEVFISAKGKSIAQWIAQLYPLDATA